MNKMRFALVGAGRWGKVYIQTISRFANIEITALCTSNPKNKDLVSTNCHICSQWDEIFTLKNIDGLILAVPPSIQFDILLKNSNYKIPVILEKPLTINAKQSEELTILYSNKGIISLIDHIYLFHPAYMALKENLHLIGPIKNIVTEGGSCGPFREHTSPLWDYGPHDLSMCLDITGEYPTKIKSKLISSKKNKKTSKEIWEVNLQFPNGIHTKSTLGNAMRKKIRTIEVIGENGSLIFDNFEKEKLRIKKNSKFTTISIPDINKLPLDIAIETFANAIRGKDDYRLGLTLGSNIVRILEKCDLNN
tara:strand:- start:4163 stop:5083 length:921 start_codon:yes stop_codon:yes gene_type:complete